VLEEPCQECGYEVRYFPRGDIGSLVRSSAAQWKEILAGDEPNLRRRPRPDRWSALEYAAHVRDVFALYDQRLRLMLTQDGPRYPNWNQDETAVEKNYAEADPADVAAELSSNTANLAAQFDSVAEEDWERTGFRSDGAAFTVESFARYFIHDPQHHLHDVRIGLATLDS